MDLPHFLCYFSKHLSEPELLLLVYSSYCVLWWCANVLIDVVAIWYSFTCTWLFTWYLGIKEVYFRVGYFYRDFLPYTWFFSVYYFATAELFIVFCWWVCMDTPNNQKCNEQKQKVSRFVLHVLDAISHPLFHPIY